MFDLYAILSVLLFLANLLLIIVPVLLGVAILTLLERKVIGYMQFRKGPNLVGPLGVLQPLADGLKLFIKETFGPTSSLPLMFILAPGSFFFLAIALWGLIPVRVSGLNLELSFLLILGISSLSAYPVLIAGWASNSKYALLGALRGGAQIVSYEVSFSLIIFPLLFFLGSWNLCFFSSLSEYCFLVVPFFPLFIMWYISCLAETNRAPFDLTEGESELVSGYNVEFSGGPFALFFIGEYANIIFINVLSVILFFSLGSSGAFYSPVVLSVFGLFFVFSFLWVRSSFPRIRYDQLMMLMWKVFLPLCLSLLFLYFVSVFVLLGNFI
uniref:NADH dehydrogenase subunit 1 n=1 Tax=Ophiothrix exigua TaxID=1815227 RepID=UPI00286AB0F8|nr:NADH dehydrogenase subunit 1 [Ophiothrix exigua]WKW95567.1 NADH dehydrogenase subunit 1 [Ophiothrix exigua]